jgi:hypothetical protein
MADALSKCPRLRGQQQFNLTQKLKKNASHTLLLHIDTASNIDLGPAREVRVRNPTSAVNAPGTGFAQSDLPLQGARGRGRGR